MARFAVQRMVEPRQKNNGNAGEIKDAVVSLGALPGNDVELRSNQPPPRFWQHTIGYPAIMDNVLITDALGPFAFKMKRRGGRIQNALLRARDDFRLHLAHCL